VERGKERKGHQISSKGIFIWRHWVLLLALVAFAGCGQSNKRNTLRLSLPESPVPYEQAWKSSLDASLLFYDRLVVEDPQSGYFQTSWKTHQVGVLIGTPVKRSRLMGRVVSRSPFRLDLDFEQEAFSLELGRWLKDPPDRKRLKEINDRMKARLRLF